MEPTVAQTPTEYIPRSEFDTLIEKVISALQPRIELAVQKAFELSDAKLDERLDERIAVVKGEIRGEFDTKLNQHIEAERNQRQQDTETVREQVQALGNETRETLSEVKKSLGEARQMVEKLTHEIHTWSNSLDANQQLYAQNRSDIEKQDQKLTDVTRDLGALEESQATLTEKVIILNSAIYGGGGDGPKSIFRMFEDINVKLDFQQTQLGVALELGKDTALRQDKYEQDLQARNQRWSRRRQAAKTFIRESAKTPQFYLVIGIALVAIVAVFRPEALPTFIEFVQKLLAP